MDSTRLKQCHVSITRMNLSLDFKQDLQWLLMFLPLWNEKSMFFDDSWTSSTALHLYTDASDVAAAGFYKGQWFVVPFVLDLDSLQQYSINWREMFAIVVAAATFGNRWRGKRTMLHCDNQCVVNVINSGTCKSADIMHLVRMLVFVSAVNNFEISSCYISTKANMVADSLSRLQFDRFFSLVPGADEQMTYPVFEVFQTMS